LDGRDWLFASRERIEVTSWSPEEAAGRAMRETLPTGRDAQRIRRLMNEMQMLLHAHDCNETRTALGQQAANAVWLWGFGVAGPTVTSAVSLPPLASTDDWLRNLWWLFGGHVDSPDALLASEPSARPLLIADTAAVDTAEASRQLLASDARLFTPLRQAMIERRVRSVEWFTGTATRRLAGSGPWWRRWLGRG
jgi:hypothetical protein